MGQAAIRVQLLYESEHTPLFVTRESLRCFGQNLGDTPGKQTASRAWAALMYNHRSKVYTPQFTRAWNMIAGLREVAEINDGRLEIHLVRRLAAYLAQEVGEDGLREQSVAYSLGPSTVNFLIVYTADVLGLNRGLQSSSYPAAA